jgi:hypothetical protein
MMKLAITKGGKAEISGLNTSPTNQKDQDDGIETAKVSNNRVVLSRSEFFNSIGL